MRRARFHAERDAHRYHQAQVAVLALVYSREGNHSAGGTTVLTRDPAISSEVRAARMSQRGRRRPARWRYADVPPGYRGAVCAKLASDRIERGAAHPGYGAAPPQDSAPSIRSAAPVTKP
jgi:hypothetical protein